MVQAFFLTILVFALMAGAFVSFPSLQNINPLKFMMEGSGYDSVEAINAKRVEQLEATDSKGLIKSREEMDDSAQQQNEILDKMRDQQQEMRQKVQDQEEMSRERIEDQQNR